METYHLDGPTIVHENPPSIQFPEPYRGGVFKVTNGGEVGLKIVSYARVVQMDGITPLALVPRGETRYMAAKLQPDDALGWRMMEWSEL